MKMIAGGCVAVVVVVLFPIKNLFLVFAERDVTIVGQ